MTDVGSRTLGIFTGERAEQTVRDNRITIRLSDDELEFIDTLCDDVMLSRSEVIRTLLSDEKTKNRRFKMTEEYRNNLKTVVELSGAYEKISTQISKFGNNANQAVKLMYFNGVDDRKIDDLIAAHDVFTERVYDILKSYEKGVEKSWQSLK